MQDTRTAQIKTFFLATVGGQESLWKSLPKLLCWSCAGWYARTLRRAWFAVPRPSPSLSTCRPAAPLGRLNVRRSNLKRMKTNVNSTTIAPAIAGFVRRFPTRRETMPRNNNQFCTENVGPPTWVRNSTSTAASTCESARRKCCLQNSKNAEPGAVLRPAAIFGRAELSNRSKQRKRRSRFSATSASSCSKRFCIIGHQDNQFPVEPSYGTP